MWYPGLDPGTTKKNVSGKTGEIWVNPGVYLIKLKCLLNFDKCTKVIY